jgi:hypothetical protein
MQISNMTGKAALVTGAASGLGRATAIKLAEAGAECSASSTSTPPGWRRRLPVCSEARFEALLHMPPTSPSRTIACKRRRWLQAVARFGRLDALCNVAGIIKFMANSADEMPAERTGTRTIAINLSAPFFLSQAAIPHLLEANGAIVNVASSAAFIGEAYAACLLRQQGRAGESDQGDGDGIFAQADPHQRGGAGRDDHQHRQRHDHARQAVEYDLIQRFSGPARPGRGGRRRRPDRHARLAGRAFGYHGACISIDAGITAG